MLAISTSVCQAQSYKDVQHLLRPYILKEAAWALTQQPITVTAETCIRSAGGRHDFYSEGDYWWPDSTNVDGPYVQRDGLTNPDNFTAHRKAMIRFSSIVAALVSAYRITSERRYLEHATLHLKAWFIDSATRMNPNLQYAQAIKGRATGRGIGIIDTIHLLEVAQSLFLMMQQNIFDETLQQGFTQWFNRYLQWLTTHRYGLEEMNAKNNHGTCWVLQVACFARLTRNDSLTNLCMDRYKNVLLPQQMAADGSFPLELKRTKPYGYSIFNLDAMVATCHILSDAEPGLWNFATPNGRAIQKGIAFLHPYLKDKSRWPFPKDVMYDEHWPVAQPGLLFGALQYRNKDWYTTWRLADHNPVNEEVVRNLPIRHPLLWLNP